jgi:hypothetical protein
MRRTALGKLDDPQAILIDPISAQRYRLAPRDAPPDPLKEPRADE